MSTHQIAQQSALIILGISVRQDEHGRYSLNDLHRAAMASGRATASQRPGIFLDSAGVKAFVGALDTDAGIPASVSSVRGGVNQGTYGARLVVLRYASWIDPVFEVQVYRSFDEAAVKPQAAARAAVVIPSDYAQALRALACEVEEKERIAAEKALADAELVTARPKAVACDVLSESEGERSIRIVAKELGVQETALVKTLIAKDWLFRARRTDGGPGTLQPTARIVQRGFAKMVTLFTDSEKTKTRDTLRVTNAGLTRLAALVAKWGLKAAAVACIAGAAQAFQMPTAAELAADPGLAGRLLDDRQFMAGLVANAAVQMAAAASRLVAEAYPSTSESNRV